MLVDDWENVTKSQQLVPLPHIHPVNEILNDYLAHERPRREEGSASLEILEEVISGLREYFDKCLGRILLYRFERAQYYQLHQQWNSGPDSEHKSAGDTYGAEHLARLLGMHPSSCFSWPRLMIRSIPPRTHCADQHGSTVRQPPTRRTHQVHHLVWPPCHQIFCQRIRNPKPRVCCASQERLGAR